MRSIPVFRWPFAACLLLSFTALEAGAFTVLGTGSGALLGGDLTDPEDDGDDSTFAGANFNWLTVTGTSEVNFGSEGALDAFDNKVLGGDGKWCCEPPPQWLGVEIGGPYVLTHFTVSSGNDAPERDPTEWFIEGSNDGASWEEIYHWGTGSSPFTTRLQVLRFEGGGDDFAKPPPYQWFRYRVTAITSGPYHQIGEIEFFGVPAPAINRFTVDRPLIPPGEAIALSWDVDPAVTDVSLDHGIGSVLARSIDGVGQLSVYPGPTATTTYTLSTSHPDGPAQESLTVTVTDQPVIVNFSASDPIISSGDSATLSWDVLNASSLDLDGSDVTGTTSIAVSPAATTLYTLTATNPNGSTSSQQTIQAVIPGVPTITEFLASNDGALIVDEDGDASDWIELHNPSGSPALLGGYFLSDDRDDLQKWQLPGVILEPGGYLLVFASGKDRAAAGAELHSNFSLDAGGEFLALVKPDGSTIAAEFSFPSQQAGISFGRFSGSGETGYFDAATPGEANSGSGFLGFVRDTTFSVDRGFYDTPQSLTISSKTAGATIRYTPDGSTPSEIHGTIFTAPITIDRTMPVRAIAYKADHRPTNVDTHSYIFVDDVLDQSPAITQSTYGLPAGWGGTAPDYGMDTRVTNSHAATIRDDLKTVPTLSLVLPAEDMFGSGGIYSNPLNSGLNWERGTSLEIIDPAMPDGSNNIQVDCGIRIQGGAFRRFDLTKKKSFRVLFKGVYGDSKLRYPLFGPEAAQEFDTLILRMESNDGYQWDNRSDVQYARDEFGRRSALDLGIPSSRGRFLHLYINGVYWGLYNPVERPDVSFGAAYFGADKEEWDGINFGTATNGTSTAYWNTLVNLAGAITGAPDEPARTAAYMRTQGLNPDGSSNPGLADYINIDNMADYLLVNWYTGNNDWPHRNYYTGRERDPIDAVSGSRTSTGTHFFMWDVETSMFLNSSTNKLGATDGVNVPFGHIRNSEEFRVRLGDRAHRALFNGGALTAGPCAARYAEITRDHTSILIPELARWGDQHGTLRTIANWQSAYDRIQDEWLAVRTPALVSILRGAGYYPAIDAPVYSQHGASVPSGTGPTLSVPNSLTEIYYRFGPGDDDPDDYRHSLDPRLVGGGIHPAATRINLDGGGGPTTTRFVRSGDDWAYLDDASDQGSAWRVPGFDDSAWPSGPSQLGYGDGDEATVVNYVDIDPATGGDQKNATTYFRKTISIDDPSVFGDFTLDYTYDDGVAIYINGTEVARQFITANAPSAEYASGGGGENATASATLNSTVFVAGTNTIAAEIHQNGSGSSDISFDLTLTGNPPGGAGSHASEPVPITAPGWLLSRSYDSATGEWSALNAAFFSVDSVPADASNLVISELAYRPAAGDLDRDKYEFVELQNIAAQSIDLGGVGFTDGIDYDFPEHTILAPGGRIVIVADRAAFAQRFPGIPVAGEFSGALNNDGEQIVLTSTQTGSIRDFTYNDQAPWPTAPDGSGHSLVLIAPGSNPDHNDPANWRSSANTNGTPGAGDTTSFAAWKLSKGITDDTGDDDHDGLNNFGEFAAGTPHDSPVPNRSPSSRIRVVGGEPFLAIDIPRDPTASDAVEIRVLFSTDLTTWTEDAVYLGESTPRTVSFRAPVPLNAGQHQFLRARYQSR